MDHFLWRYFLLICNKPFRQNEVHKQRDFSAKFATFLTGFLQYFKFYKINGLSSLKHMLYFIHFSLVLLNQCCGWAVLMVAY